MTSAIKDFLSANGLWLELVPKDSQFVKSVCRILPEDADSEKLALALELVISRYASNRMLLAKLCALLKQATGKGPTEIAACLFVASPGLARSVSEISKLVKAGEMWLKWPMLGDIENPDKLATLKRVPNQLKAQIFNSGEFPDGTPIRGLTCAELRDAVNALRPDQQPKTPVETSLRLAKQRLISLANTLSGLSELMQGIPELEGTKEKIEQWHAELLATLTAIPERVRPALALRSSAGNNRAVMSQVTTL